MYFLHAHRNYIIIQNPAFNTGCEIIFGKENSPFPYMYIKYFKEFTKPNLSSKFLNRIKNG